MQRALEAFWMGLWNQRNMDRLLAGLDPAYRQTDHRPVNTWNGESRDQWRALMESWWELVPDARVTHVQLLAGDDRRMLYQLRIEGGGPQGIGDSAWDMYVVNTRGPDGRARSADLFEDHEAAEAFFASGD